MAIYPALGSLNILPNAGGRVQPEDAVRFAGLPAALEMGGKGLPPAWLFQWGTAKQGGAPVVAVDLVVHSILPNGLYHGGVIGFVYANGAYVRPAFNDARGERPWADIHPAQVQHVWRNNAFVV